MIKAMRKKRSQDKFIWTERDRLLITSPDGIIRENDTGRIIGRRLPSGKIVKTTQKQAKEGEDDR
jgi:hypothetical protein